MSPSTRRVSGRHRAARAGHASRIIHILGGLADSAFAALCTFAVGLVAIRSLPDAGVALFSLMLTGYIIGMILPRNIVLTHVELVANRSSELFVPRLRTSLMLTGTPLTVAALIAMASGAPVWGHVSPSHYAAMAVGAGIATVSGAILTHVRATMHVVRLHVWAGVTSATNVVVTLTVLLIGHACLSGAALWGLPFGALALGQIVSLGWWRYVVSRMPARAVGPATPLRSRLLYLVPIGAAQLAIYAQSTLVVRLLGPSQSAHLESARVAASPVYILASGLGALLLPPLVRALATASVRRTLVGLARAMGAVTTAGLVYALALTGLGPLLGVVFGRVVDAPLAAARAAAFSIDGPTSMNLNMLIALDEFARPAWVSVLSAIASVVATLLLLPHLGLFSVPLGQALSAVIQVGVGLYLTLQILRRQQASRDQPA